MTAPETPPLANDDEPKGMRLHLGIAEQGKVYALAGDYGQALRHYRAAMQMAVQAGDPEIFFRHYLDCVMESLEYLGSFDEVLEYCDKAIAFYGEKPPPNPVAMMDLASIHLRRGVILLKKKDAEKAKGAFRNSVNTAKTVGGKLELAATLLRWLEAGLQIDPQRVLAEQKRTKYFSVRSETVDPRRAVKLADAGATTPGKR